MNSFLIQRWTALFHPWGMSPERCLETYQHIIHASYTEPHRRYHTDDHIANCIEVVDKCIPYVRDVASIVLALFFHDIVYDPKEGGNEKASAALLYRMSEKLRIPVTTYGLAEGAILATTHKAEPQNDVDRYVVDVDLSVLAWPEEKYDRDYAWKVREEYSFVPDKIFKEERAKILEEFVERPFIYNTKFFRVALEQAARDNLRREIGFLRRTL